MNWLIPKKLYSKEELEKIINQLELGTWIPTSNEVEISIMNEEDFNEIDTVDTNNDDLEDENEQIQEDE